MKKLKTKMSKILIFGLLGFLIGAFPCLEVSKHEAEADLDEPPDSVLETLIQEEPKETDSFIMVENNSLVPSAYSLTVTERLKVVVTGYSSTPQETDDTPFITASGTTVREGIVAANFLPMGSQIRMPELYGEQIFVVEDRMHPRKKWHVDIWFPSRRDALNFGAQFTEIEIVKTI